MLLSVFGSMLAFLILSIPVAVCIGLSCLAFAPWMPKGIDSVMFFVAQRMVVTADSFTLLALPFFILAGTMMTNSGIAKKLTDLAEAIAGDFPGGLGIAAIVACCFFGAVSGSGPATVAAIGSVILPAMLARGYSVGYSGGLLACAGGIGVLIPPSVPMIVYGINSGAAITDMFLAGIFPGLLVGLCLAVPTYLIAKRKGYAGMPRQEGDKTIAQHLWDAKATLFMPFIILGGIYSGVFTPTEAGITAVLYAIALGLITGGLTFRGFCDAVIDAAAITGSCIFLMGTASAFAKLLHLKGVPDLITNIIFSVTQSKYIILLMFNLVFLIGGMFIDTLSNILIFSPIFLPLAKKIGVDPIHFGIFIITNLALGMVTPPMGIDLFIAANICKTPFERILKGSLPFMLANLVAVLLITYFPFLSLWPLWLFR